MYSAVNLTRANLEVRMQAMDEQFKKFSPTESTPLDTSMSVD